VKFILKAMRCRVSLGNGWMAGGGKNGGAGEFDSFVKAVGVARGTEKIWYAPAGFSPSVDWVGSVPSALKFRGVAKMSVAG
jgi:hypothetical protein